MIALAVLAGLLSALVQGGPLASLGDAGAAFAVPGALAAGWAAVRGPREAIALAFSAAVVLGVLSEARVGLFALALLPAVAAGTLAMAERPGRRIRSIRASLAGWLGAVAYVVLLVVTAGVSPSGPSIAWGLLASGVVAGFTCLLIFPLR
ncbi:MAG: hypothetical protein EPO65_05140, partial [Dehalococcoidia bacterium]